MIDPLSVAKSRVLLTDVLSDIHQAEVRALQESTRIGNPDRCPGRSGRFFSAGQAVYVLQ